MKYYIIYKTTIISTGQFYIGKHSCNNPYDDYFGSSDVIKKYILKNGLYNIKKEILSFCDNEHQMSAIESIYISENINKNLCLNRANGMSLKKYIPNKENNNLLINVNDIAEKLNISNRAVQNKCKKEGLLKISNQYQITNDIAEKWYKDNNKTKTKNFIKNKSIPYILIFEIFFLIIIFILYVRK